MSERLKKGFILPFYVGSILTTVAVAAMTLVSEVNSPFKSWLATTFGHHWVGKSVIAIMLFTVSSLATYPMLRNRRSASLTRWTIVLLAVLIAAILAITGFFTIDYLSG